MCAEAVPSADEIQRMRVDLQPQDKVPRRSTCNACMPPALHVHTLLMTSLSVRLQESLLISASSPSSPLCVWMPGIAGNACQAPIVQHLPCESASTRLNRLLKALSVCMTGQCWGTRRARVPVPVQGPPWEARAGSCAPREAWQRPAALSAGSLQRDLADVCKVPAHLQRVAGSPFMRPSTSLCALRATWCHQAALCMRAPALPHTCRQRLAHLQGRLQRKVLMALQGHRCQSVTWSRVSVWG